MSFDFFKYHALGNDYLVIDPNKTKINLTVENIKLICHRNLGIGSDGILYGPIFDGAKIRLKILNSDGSEAEKSGNGIRIFAKYLVDTSYVSGNTFSLFTLGGKVDVELLDPMSGLIRVDMGTVTFQSDVIPVTGLSREVVDETLTVDNKVYRVTCLTIGNPHCVIPLKNISKNVAIKIGPLVEKHPNFPNRINVQFLKVIDKNNIQIEIWERGAGYTLASGSSSCAAAIVAYKLGLVENKIKVHMPGGIIDIQINADGHIYMTGLVSGIAKGYFLPELWELLDK